MNVTPIPATENNIAHAARALVAGELVAFPTETVYGLGADATNAHAVASIFAAKGRPTFNPLIIHLPSAEAAWQWGACTPAAERLAAAFWPGGLTLVLEKTAHREPRLCDLVSAGLSTVAIRVPAHRIAHALLEQSGVPVAAPSANRSGHVSATTADHVAADFSADLDDGGGRTTRIGAHRRPVPSIILDDGPCPLGLESTILDVRTDQPVLLRPGAVTREAIMEKTGLIIQPHTNETPPATDERSTTARTSPGQLESHYAPAKKVHLSVDEPTKQQAYLAFGPGPSAAVEAAQIINLSPAGDLTEAAANLFAALRALDDGPGNSIAVASIPDQGLGRAINDRLRRAAAPPS